MPFCYLNCMKAIFTIVCYYDMMLLNSISYTNFVFPFFIWSENFNWANGWKQFLILDYMSKISRTRLLELLQIIPHVLWYTCFLCHHHYRTLLLHSFNIIPHLSSTIRLHSNLLPKAVHSITKYGWGPKKNVSPLILPPCRTPIITKTKSFCFELITCRYFVVSTTVGLSGSIICYQWVVRCELTCKITKKRKKRKNE